jgi:hypothetical protein
MVFARTANATVTTAMTAPVPAVNPVKLPSNRWMSAYVTLVPNMSDKKTTTQEAEIVTTTAKANITTPTTTILNTVLVRIAITSLPILALVLATDHLPLNRHVNAREPRTAEVHHPQVVPMKDQDNHLLIAHDPPALPMFRLPTPPMPIRMEAIHSDLDI